MTHPTFDEENLLWENGYEYVVGIDEVGRGCFAGPVVAAAVAFPKNFLPNENCAIKSVCDSKLLTSEKRELIDPVIKSHAAHYAIEIVGLNIINNDGIGTATNMALQYAVDTILLEIHPMRHSRANGNPEKNAGFRVKSFDPELKTEGPGMTKQYFILVDGYLPKPFSKQNAKGIINGDKKSFSIAAASIIAKVYRDQLMRDLDKQYPQYLFAKNKGYGTRQHQQAIKQFGLSTLHRTSFNLSKFL